MSLKKRSVTINGHPSSITLEEPFWQELKSIAAMQKRSVNEIVTEIDAGLPDNLSSALRVYILAQVKENKR